MEDPYEENNIIDETKNGVNAWNQDNESMR